MCGVAGIFRVNGRVTSEDVAAVLKMMEAEVHRGPDDWGILLPDEALQNEQVRGLLSSFEPSHIRTYRGSVAAPAAVLGTQRLSIIDLSPRGRMPMGTADGLVWITYNGEIYNFQELRDELGSRGYGFHSRTDTETILHGYEEWGEEVVQHLRGMFVFVILDLRAADDPKLFLAKDRFGMKPLYWARKNCVFQFASEVRALMAGGLMPNEPEPRGFHGFLVMGSVPTPFTTVRDVYSLPAAHMLTIDERTYSYPKPRRYWTLPKAASLSINPREAAGEVRRLLDESIKMHLVSDVPLGVFLSGGIDSSATALAAKHLPEPLTSLCVTFDEEEFSEGKYAAQVASRFGCKHIEVRLHAKEFVEEIPQILAAMDQPSVDGVNTYFVSKAARAAGLTVVISGLGGDELFWGYPGFHTGPRLGRWARIPGVRLAAMFVGAVGKRFGYERLEKLEFLRESGALGPYLTLRGLFLPSRAAHLLGSGRFPLTLPDMKRRSLTSSDYAELETALYLQNQLLRDSDVFGMAHSLEIRLPFLDHRLAEFVFALPESFKISSTANKPLLLSALEGILGSETVNRPKMGFTFPFERWMREHRAAILRHTEPGTTVDAAQAKAIWDVFTEGRIHWSRPWAVSVLGGMTRLGNLPSLVQKNGGPERILFLLPEVFSSKGGIPVYNQNLLRAVGETFPHSEMRVISVNDSAIPSEAAAFSRLHFIGCGPRDSSFLKMRVVLTALRETLRHRPDLIVCGHLNLSPLALLLSGIGGAHTALLAYGIDAWAPTPILRWAAQRIHRVFPISRYTADRMQAWGINRDRIRILPAPVDGEVFRPIRRKKPPKGKALLTIARLDACESYKGVDLVINVLREVRADHPDVRYLVAGKGDDLPRLEALAKEVGVAELVEFLGHVPDEDLPALLSEADLFVMPSWREGFGIVFLEALACGVPVVAGNRDGSVDAVLDGRTGLLVDPQDSEQLLRAIISVLNATQGETLRDPTYLRHEVLTYYGFDSFREKTRAVLMR